jgi:uncharacterized protein YraI
MSVPRPLQAHRHALGWLTVVIAVLGAVGALASRLTTPARAAVDREAIVSYDRMQPGAPQHGYFISAWQPFTARSSVVTHVGVTVGNPTLPSSQPVPYDVTIRLCDAQPDASGVCARTLAQAAPQIVNYGNSYADLGDVAVTPGRMYWVVWLQPPFVAGTSWVTYWWAGGSTVTTSDQMQMVVRGYDPDGTAPAQPPSPSAPSGHRYAIANVVQVNLRAGPGTGFPLRGALPGGAPIDIACQTVGTSVNGSTIWDQLIDGRYVSDWYTTTPSVGDYSPGIPQCQGAPADPHPAVSSGRWSIVAEAAVSLHTGPGVDRPVVGSLAPGARFDIACQTTGSAVYGSAIWDRLPDDRYVADYFADTPVYADFSPGIPRCDGGDAFGSGGVQPALAGFSRAGAVAWADAHVVSPDDFAGDDCTSFVSHAWNAGGGARETSWWFFRFSRRVGLGYSSTWADASNFADAMTDQGWVTRTEIVDLGARTVPDARPGDVILWHADPTASTTWSHLAIVAGTGPRGITLIDQHSDERYRTPWNEVWHKRDDPLYRNFHMRAQLLHLRT